jgi:hypothetical protein
MTASINLPVLVAVSRAWLPEIDKTRRLTFLRSSRATIAKVAHRPGKPIERGTNELVPFADVIEGGLKLLALGDRRHLLAEYLLAPGSAKVALLRLQAGYLSQ